MLPRFLYPFVPTISAVMVFHRDQPFLRGAIASVLGQTWRDMELILVDNGTGLTSDALGDLGNDPRLRWVRLPTNEGIEKGYNAGIVAFLDPFVCRQSD